LSKYLFFLVVSWVIKKKKKKKKKRSLSCVNLKRMVGLI
jgi:hypothetical protein